MGIGPVGRKSCVFLLCEAGGYMLSSQREGAMQGVSDYKSFFDFLLIKVLFQDCSVVYHSVQY